MKVTIIRCDGREEEHDVPARAAMPAIAALIGAETLDAVNLRDGRVMLVDDAGYETTAEHVEGARFQLVPVRARKPDNPAATTLYHRVCRPGVTHRIVGDVAVCHDEDFA